MKDRARSQELFGRELPPMIFQYNSLDYIIETTRDGELVFTIGRQTSAAPKIRYNLHDLGGTITHKQLAQKLAARGLSVSGLAAAQSRFPLLFVYGRSDLTVPFYGAKVYPSDIEEIINSHPSLMKQVNSFQIASYEDAQINRRLKIRLETVKDLLDGVTLSEELRDLFFDGLCRCNQDFREVAKMFDRSCVEIEVYKFETGPFSERDIRVKNKYIGAS